MTDKQGSQIPVSEGRRSDSLRAVTSRVIADPGDDTLEWADVRAFFARRWKLILAVTVLSLAASVAFLILTPPVYRAEVLLAPVQDEQAQEMSALVNQLGGLASIAGVNLGDRDAAIEETMAVLRSRHLTADFIRSESLMPVLFSDLWNASAQNWDVEDADDEPTIWDGVGYFDQEVRSLFRDRRSGLVTLAIEWTDPELAAQWADKLVERLNRYEREEAIRNAEKTIAYLTERLAETSVLEMRQMIFRLLEVQTKKVILAKTRDEFVFRTIDPAVVPEKPVWPSKLPTLLLGLLGGLAIGIFLAVALNALGTREPA